MCKETIEKAAMAANGINNANWNIETKMFEVSFNAEKISLEEIHKVIAGAGYDTELERADDKVYDNLHGCCQYVRGDFGDAPGSENLTIEEFKVYGNCGMCKDRIEEATNAIDGVKDADWNNDNMMLKISFDSEKTNLPEIHKVIAKVGHDTELEKADDEVYTNLPSCCKYERPKNN